MLVGFYSTLDTSSSQEREKSELKNGLNQTSLQLCLRKICVLFYFNIVFINSLRILKEILTDDWCGSGQPTVGSTMPGQVGLNCLRKLAKHACISELAK